MFFLNLILILFLKNQLDRKIKLKTTKILKEIMKSN